VNRRRGQRPSLHGHLLLLLHITTINKHSAHRDVALSTSPEIASRQCCRLARSVRGSRSLPLSRRPTGRAVRRRLPASAALPPGRAGRHVAGGRGDSHLGDFAHQHTELVQIV